VRGGPGFPAIWAPLRGRAPNCDALAGGGEGVGRRAPRTAAAAARTPHHRRRPPPARTHAHTPPPPRPVAETAVIARARARRTSSPLLSSPPRRRSYKNYGISALFKTSTDKIDVVSTIDNIAPGLKAAIHATLPDTQSGGCGRGRQEAGGRRGGCGGQGARRLGAPSGQWQAARAPRPRHPPLRPSGPPLTQHAQPCPHPTPSTRQASCCLTTPRSAPTCARRWASTPRPRRRWLRRRCRATSSTVRAAGGGGVGAEGGGRALGIAAAGAAAGRPTRGAFLTCGPRPCTPPRPPQRRGGHL
jgi:hypothetical protein